MTVRKRGKGKSLTFFGKGILDILSSEISISEIPVSGKKLLSILEKKGPLTQKQLIKASAPQAEAFNYAVDLTSLTQGRGRFSQKLLKYEELPYNLTEKLIEERKTQEE